MITFKQQKLRDQDNSYYIKTTIDISGPITTREFIAILKRIDPKGKGVIHYYCHNGYIYVVNATKKYQIFSTKPKVILHTQYWER